MAQKPPLICAGTHTAHAWRLPSTGEIGLAKPGDPIHDWACTRCSARKPPPPLPTGNRYRQYMPHRNRQDTPVAADSQGSSR